MKPSFQIDSNLQTKMAFIGSRLSLTCPFDNFDHFKWIKDDELYTVQENDIEIEHVTPEHEGSFMPFFSSNLRSALHF